MRYLALFLLIISVYSQTLILPPTNSSVPPPPQNNTPDFTHNATDNSTLSLNLTNVQDNSSGYTDVNADALSDVQLYIQSVIRDAASGLDNYLLVAVKQKISVSNTSNIVYLYTFAPFNNQTLNLSNVPSLNDSNVVTFAVLASNNNTQFIVYDGQNFSSVYIRPLNNNHYPIVGGFTAIDITNLASDQIAARDFVLKNVPKLSNWTLVSAKSQVVAGLNYCFQYSDGSKNSSESYCVWSQPWAGFLQLTLPDGTKIVNKTASTPPVPPPLPPSDSVPPPPNGNSTTTPNSTLESPPNPASNPPPV